MMLMRTLTSLLVSLQQACFGLLFLTHTTFAQSNIDSADYCYLPLVNASVCPAPSQLILDQKTSKWNTKTGWRSPDSTFTKEVTTFLGAQWQGVQMGQVVCLYQGPEKKEFEIRLQKDSMIAYSPKDLSSALTAQGSIFANPWTVREEKTQTLMECYARTNSPCDCPWIPLVEQEKSIEEIVDSIDKPNFYPAWAM